MPSRAVTSFLRGRRCREGWTCCKCQCPLGLLPHFYLINFFEENSESHYPCQCPLGLLPHFYNHSSNKWGEAQLSVSMPSRAVTSFLPRCCIIRSKPLEQGVNALSGCYLISTVPLQKPRFYAVSRACFCRYLSEYSDNSCFSCMLTIWTYLTRYICL